MKLKNLCDRVRLTNRNTYYLPNLKIARESIFQIKCVNNLSLCFQKPRIFCTVLTQWIPEKLLKRQSMKVIDEINFENNHRH